MMFSRTNLKVAFAHMTSRKRQSIIATLSVTFGVGLFIFMKSFVGGINQLQADLVFSGMAHIRIYNEVNTQAPDILQPSQGELIYVSNPKAIQYTEGIKNSEEILSLIEQQPGIASVTTQLNTSVTYKNGSVKKSGLLSGVDVERENQLFNMNQFIVQGTWDELNRSNNHIIIGKKLAEKLNLTLGSNLTVTTPDQVTRNFKVVGIVFTGSPAVDDNKGYIRKSAALQMNSKNRSYATDIQINVPDFNQAQVIAAKLKTLVPFKVESWQEANEQLVSANGLRDLISTIVPLVLIIVAGFGIYNIMTMTVNEKIKDIAILKALGFGGKDVIGIFLSQAIVVGLVGGLGGIALGYTISTLMGRMPFEMAASDHLVILFRPRDYIQAFSIGLLITLIAGYLPARKASGVDPVQIIRG